MSGPAPFSAVAVAGSRRLPPLGPGLVAAVCRSLAASGRSLVVGCCRGTDEAVLGLVGRGVPAAQVRCLAAFGPVSPSWRSPSGRYSAPGAWSGSAVRAVAEFLLSGGSVSWWAGGGPSVPLAARLAARTAAVVAQASALAVFFGSPVSRGSALAVRCAVERGLPVVAFPVGFPGQSLPGVCGGAWVPCRRRGVWSQAWRWVPPTGEFF